MQNKPEAPAKELTIVFGDDRRPSLALQACLFVAWLTIASIVKADDKDASAALDALGGRTTRNAAGEIVGVALRGAWVTDADLATLARLPKLETIDLSYSKVTDLGLEELVPLQNVKVLNLYYAEYVTDLGIAHLKRWKNLELLNVRGTKVTSSMFEHVANMTKLRFLDVGHSRVNDDFFENLAGLERLEYLSFGGNKMSGAALAQLKLLPALKELSVSGSQRTDSGLWNVAVTDFNLDHIAALHGLEFLDLGETGVTDRGLAKLAMMKELSTLDLRGTRVTAKGLAALGAMPQLRHLKLWKAKSVDDAAVPALLQLKNLEVLELPESGLTADGLAKLAGHSRLKQLLIGGLDLNADRLASLRQAMPACRISWWEQPTIEPTSGRSRGD